MDGVQRGDREPALGMCLDDPLQYHERTQLILFTCNAQQPEVDAALAAG